MRAEDVPRDHDVLLVLRSIRCYAVGVTAAMYRTHLVHYAIVATPNKSNTFREFLFMNVGPALALATEDISAADRLR